MITSCGYTPRKGTNNNIAQFKSCLEYLATLGYIENIDVKNIKINNYIACDINIPFTKDENNNDIQFFQLQYNNFMKIINCSSRLDKCTILKVYCYILARIFKNNNIASENIENNIYDDSVIECFYDSYNNICKDLNLSRNTYNNIIDLLMELDLIYFGNIGNVKNYLGETVTANNVYAENKKELKRGLSMSKKWYCEQGYIL